jgi:xanthine dehydrogenase accessory factor
LNNIYEQILHVRDSGEEAMLVTVVESEGSVPAPPGTKMLVYPDGHSIGTVGGGALEKLARRRAAELLHERRSKLVRYALGDNEAAHAGEEPTGMLCGGRAALFFDYIGHGAQLVIFGGGHVGQALLRHAQALGLYVTIIDHRPELAASIECAGRVLVGDYVAALDAHPVPPGGYYVIATPSHVFDYAVLKRVMTSDWQPAYVGVIGSKNKALANAQRLAEEVTDIDWDVLYCPVGLDIGGPSPDEIAISILAEIQALRNGKAGHRHIRLKMPEDLTNK